MEQDDEKAEKAVTLASRVVVPPPSGPSPPLTVRLFGGCEIRVKANPLTPLRSRRDGWLLSLLVLRHDRETSREFLADTFWPDTEGERALFYLRRSLTSIRQALGPEAPRLLSPSPRTLRLDMTGAFADVLAFDGLLALTPPRRAEAVALYAGPLLPDCPDVWAVPEREERRLAHLDALEGLARQARAQDGPAASVPWLRRLLAADPHRESAGCALMQALSDGGDRAAAAEVYQDLRRRLRQDLNSDVGPETRALFKQLTDRDTVLSLSTPAATPAQPSGRHLPIPLNDLIGRETEIQGVLHWLQHCRLVTLLGTGGAGKTRLAIAAAEAALPRFPDGVWFVDLAPLAPALVPEAVARALGLGEQAGRSAEARLAEALAPASLLLVLDNCEHVLEACVSLTAFLLAGCPRLRVLTTSRQALGVMGEQVFAVPALGLPPADPLGPRADTTQAEKNLPALLDYASVRLFVERASQASPAFRLSRRNADAVVEICRRLDGIPLALELAAARVRALSPHEICARLEDRLGLLAVGNRSAPPRHQTLRATIDWSYTLLSDAERSLLRRLSVFAGGWDMASAASVCAWDLPSEGVLDLAQSLVEKSLVSAETLETADGEQTRYRLPETVRQYARDRLRDCGEERDAHTRHRDEFLRLAAQSRPAMQGPDLAPWLDRLEGEHDNFRAALDWCVGAPDGAQPGLQLASDLFFLWWVRGYFAEGRRWYEAVLAHPGAQERTAARAKALSRAGGLISISGEGVAGARLLFEEGLTIARELGDREAEANLLCNLGDVATGADLSEAKTALEHSLVIHRSLGNVPGVAHTALLLGNVALLEAAYAEAETLYRESLALYRSLGNPQKTGHALWCLARADISQGAPARARSLLEECVDLFRSLRDAWSLSAGLALAGEAALQGGDAALARPLLAEHLTLVQRMGLRHSAPWALRCFGRLASAQGEWSRAVRLFGAADALQSGAAGALRPDETAAALSPEETAAVTAARGALEPAAYAVAWSSGRSMTLGAAVDDALRA